MFSVACAPFLHLFPIPYAARAGRRSVAARLDRFVAPLRAPVRRGMAAAAALPDRVARFLAVPAEVHRLPPSGSLTSSKR